VKTDLGPDVPLHFTRFHPDYLLKNLPPTPLATLERAKAIADAEGLHYVYIGNVPGHPAENTYCPKCRRVVIERAGFTIAGLHLDRGKCHFCQQPIPGVLGGIAPPMKTPSLAVAASALFSIGDSLIYPKNVSRGAAPKVRPPAVAGSFYPADPKELGGMLDGFLAQASPEPIADLVAVVAPHAGYVYSGPVARVLLCPAQGPQGGPRGGHRAVALRSLRLLLGVRWRRPIPRRSVRFRWTASLPPNSPALDPSIKAVRHGPHPHRGPSRTRARSPVAVPAAHFGRRPHRAHRHGRPELRELPPPWDWPWPN